MKFSRNISFLLVILFFLILGFIFTPLPSVGSITRAWINRIENAFRPQKTSQMHKEQIQSLKILTNQGKVTFSADQAAFKDALLSTIHMSFIDDLKNNRVDQLIGVFSPGYLEVMDEEFINQIEQQKQLGASIIEQKTLHQDQEEYVYLITNRSGKHFVLVVHKPDPKTGEYTLSFLPSYHPAARKTWKTTSVALAE